ncbi:hypothetical protein [Polaribacter sp.]|uniref:hypothetical protein n=1 Tax=Polaribacter sp. TaxID=1920175 RepID=UPI0025F3C96F|nr:hypothetical protein [Polaribacter sp.]
MSFANATINGIQVIQQTGTDTDLTGITSFTVYNNPPINTTLGFAIGWFGQKIYFIDRPLEITGSLTWDSSEEMLVTSADFPDGSYDYSIKLTGSSANLNIGIQIGTNLDGSPRYSKGIGLVLGYNFRSTNTVLSITTGGMIIESGATMTVNGSEIQLASGILVDSSLTAANSVVFNDTKITDISDLGNGKQTIRNAADSDIVQYNDVDFDSKFVANRFINLSGIDTFSGRFLNTFVQPHRAETGAPSVGGKVTLENVIYAKNYNSFDYQLVGNSTTATDNQAVELTNIDIGTSVRTNQPNIGSGNFALGHLSMFQNVKVTVKDTSFNAIQDCKVRIPTTNSGNRNNTLIGGQFIGNLDFTGSTYTVYTDQTNVSGETTQFKVLTGRLWNDSLSNPTIIYDLYGKSQVAGEDKFDIQFRSYLHNYATQESVFKASSDLVFDRVLTADTNITETNKTTVDAYTDLGTSQKIYDSFKLEWLDLTLNNLIVNRVGNQIDLDQTATSLIIDATAVSVRDLTGTTATVKASTYTSGAVTTASGTVTTRNGALLNGGTFDCDVNYESGVSTTLTNVTVNGILDFDTAGTNLLDGCTISNATNSSGGNITLTLLNGSTVTTNTGPNITLNQPVNITAPNIIDGSRVQIYNVTKSSELDNSVVSGGSGYSLEVNLLSSAVDIGDTIRLRATYQNGSTARKPLLSNNVITIFGLSFIDSQENLAAYSALGVDGATVSEYNIDSNTGHLQIDANDSGCESTKQRIVARYYYLITLADGIDRFFNAIVLEDEANAVIDRSITTLMLDNIGNCTLNLTDNNFRLYTSDNSSWVQDPPTGGFGVISDSGKVYAVNQDQIETIVNAIKAKTDLFNFTGSDVKATLDGEQVVASNMRGTDEANTTTPPTVSEIQTGLATEANATANKNSIIAGLDANEAKIDLVETKSEADTRQAALILEHNKTQTDISEITGIDQTQFHNYLNSYENKDNWKAVVSNLSTKTDVTTAKQDIIKYQEADQVKTTTRLIKKEKGTENILVEKNYTTDNEGSEFLTEI